MENAQTVYPSSAIQTFNVLPGTRSQYELSCLEKDGTLRSEKQEEGVPGLGFYYNMSGKPAETVGELLEFARELSANLSMVPTGSLTGALEGLGKRVGLTKCHIFYRVIDTPPEILSRPSSSSSGHWTLTFCSFIPAVPSPTCPILSSLCSSHYAVRGKAGLPAPPWGPPTHS